METSAQVRPAYEMTRNSRLKNFFENWLRRFTPKVLITLLGIALMLIFLMPLGYMLDTAFKQDVQASSQNAPLWPANAVTFSYQGPDLSQYDLVNGQALPLYKVPTSDGIKQYALVKGFREDSIFIDPAHPENGPFDWAGRYRTLDPVYQFAITGENFQAAWDEINFLLLFRNTIAIAVL